MYIDIVMRKMRVLRIVWGSAIDKEEENSSWCFTHTNKLGYRLTYIGALKIY